ncbi:MAG: bifunctional diguanylate cyclase/phosphodiesterase [Lachnospiraceae bacterium]|nr:bifunctional diguanylate cyclase/phosphodiesterase [Lachnospiraceae bacterium]
MDERLSPEKLRYYKEMVKTFPCAAFISRDDRRKQSIEVLCANREYYELTGIAHDAIEFGDHDITNLEDIATEDKLRVNREFGVAVEQKSTVAMDATVKRMDGSYMRCRIHARPLETLGDAVLFVVTFHRYDDKDPEKIIKKHYVEHDALTNIFNMKGFCQQTAEVLAACPGTRFGIIVSDVDSFKTINNMFGDEVGDHILKLIAGQLKMHFAELFKNNIPGSYGRIGSDRFAACLPMDQINPDRFCAWVDEKLQELDINYRILMHFGICEIPPRSLEVADIIEQAYLACSTVKHNLTKRYAYYDNELRKALLEEQELVAQAERALKNDEFIVYYQPVYLSDSKTLMSAEALVRWQHPDRGLLAPGSFVPVMEKNGFISKLDTCVWEMVLKFMHDRMEAGRKIVPISVNMSRQDICNPKLSEDLAALIVKYGIDPSWLHIEVTESAYIDEEVQHQLAETIHDLREKGFIILMDDFGSGYSSLNVLKDMPVDIMKIDRGLTMDIASGDGAERSKKVLSTIINLANRLSIPTIAEGVETEEQARFLNDIGCDSIQGYFFSRPIPEEEFANLLDESEVPEYRNGEAMPEHSISDVTKKRNGKVLLVGDSLGIKTQLCADWRTDEAADLTAAAEILARDAYAYCVIPGEILKKLLADGNGGV